MLQLEHIAFLAYVVHGNYVKMSFFPILQLET